MNRPATVELTQTPDLTPLPATTTGPDSQSGYAALRARWGQIAPVEIEPGVPAWLVMGHAEIYRILRSEALFSRDPRNWRWHRDGLLPDGAAILAYSPRRPRAASYHHDGAERARLRAPLDAALGTLPEKAVLTTTREVCRRLIGEFGQTGRHELVGDYCRKVGFLAMAAMFGFDAGTSARLMVDSGLTLGHGARAQEAQERIAATLVAHVRQRRSAGAADLTSALAHDRRFRSDVEIAETMAIPMHAASTFLTAWIAQTFHLILGDGPFGARWTQGRISLDDLLEEVLWRETPVANSPAPRYAMTDLRLDGKLIRTGDALVLAIAAANGDPRIHTGDPWDELGNRSHLAWGTGVHQCPAPRQARIIARVAVEELLQVADLRLLTLPGQTTWTASPWVRYPQRLPVEFRRVPRGRHTAVDTRPPAR
ncbi:cytochrome P450 [Myceligenerans crystallogenes]|uniref:Cytochrome P450 n=1 Tax=Myceligenerans crystallogenes TaxID=316335 RepID=A0ABN2NC14_9MICO